MAGPFSRQEMEAIVGGPFRSSPIQVVEKFDSEGRLVKARMAINLSYKDPSGVSVNDMIVADDTPTRWGTAAEVESIVSLCLFPLSHFPLLFPSSLSLVSFPNSQFSFENSLFPWHPPFPCSHFPLLFLLYLSVFPVLIFLFYLVFPVPLRAVVDMLHRG